jgi:hypothetical protein
MKTEALFVVASAFILPAPASAETWKNVPVVDTLCVNDVKADPDKHTKDCALECVKGGYGIILPDGVFLKFDKPGNEKTVAALKATPKEDHLRATVVGERSGNTLKVTSIAIE